MLNQVTNINTGTIANPYRQFAYTIPAGSIIKIRYDADVFSVLYTSSQNLAVNFSGSGGQTNFWQGIKYKCPYVFTYAELVNLDPVNPLDVVVAMGIGDVQDNRFSVSGAVGINNYDNQPLTTTPARYTLDSITEYTLSGTSETITPPSDALFCRIQNTGTNNLRLYSATGFVLAPFGVEETCLKDSFTIYGSANDTFVIGWFK